jgi:tripartite-type tricarboxylate transporter receptor subunit TctC
MQPTTTGVGRRQALGLMAVTLAAPTAWAQSEPNFPTRVIKIIVPFTPGGTTDILARAIGQKLTEYWGQPVVVENRPGAAGWLGITAMAKSPPDGYTIGLTISNIIYAKSLYTKLPFDIATDFEPVSMISRSAIALAVTPQFPAENLQEFIAHVRKNPGKHSYGSFGQGTSAHIFGETLNRSANIDLVHAAYKGAAPIVTDLLGGQISSAIIDTGTARPLVLAGKLKLLAMSGTQRVAALPTVPTFAEQGYKGFEPVGFFMVMAPANTPKDIVRKLSGGIARALSSDDLKTRIQEFGQEAVGSTPEELATGIKVDGDIFDRAIKAANIKVEQN